MEDTQEGQLLSLTADIVAAHVANNNVPVGDLSTLISSVHAALKQIESPDSAEREETLTPAVSIRASVRPDYLVCLEDGKKLTMLKRYLRTNYDMSPEAYRAKWNLPRDYPMVAPAYAERRRELAHSIGLGRKRVATTEAGTVEIPAPVKRPTTRKKAPSAVAEPTPKASSRPRKAATRAPERPTEDAASEATS
ncbi:MucR family transcriptional regulator [Sphingomonas oryzagri]